jgi:hypothetical protein
MYNFFNVKTVGASRNQQALIKFISAISDTQSKESYYSSYSTGLLNFHTEYLKLTTGRNYNAILYPYQTLPTTSQDSTPQRYFTCNLRHASYVSWHAFFLDIMWRKVMRATTGPSDDQLDETWRSSWRQLANL